MNCTGITQSAYQEAVRNGQEIPFTCPPCMTDALNEAEEDAQRESTRRPGDFQSLMDIDVSSIGIFNGSTVQQVLFSYI